MSKQAYKLVVLYEELAGYFMASISKLQNYGIEVHIVSKRINEEAPFIFQKQDGIFHYRKESLDSSGLKQLIEKIAPSMLFIGGWQEMNYLRMARLFHAKIPTVLGFDTQWGNTLKQNLATVLSRCYLRHLFTYCFVPGNAQKTYALKLGFKSYQIIQGAYCADTDLFSDYYNKTSHLKRRSFPHRFIYMARYVKHKGIEDMWHAFMEIQKNQRGDWELWCLGTGTMFGKRITHSKIKHFGFIQPASLEKYIAETGVFVLPSHFEPWGVALHEFTTAGFPVICSDEVGARELFLEEGRNGYIHHAHSVDSLKAAMLKMMQKTDAELLKMSSYSRKLSQRITPERWSQQILNIIKSKE